MKKRMILATVVGALFLTLVPAATAGASEETVGSCAAEVLEETGVEHAETILSDGLAEAATDEEAEALEEFEEELESCLEAPSPILPELNEIIWGGSAFVVLLGFMIWKGFPAVKNIMNARSEQIAGDLDDADKAKADAQAVKAEYEAELADAKSESARIIEEARQQAEVVRADLQARAESDIAEMRSQAAVDADAARSRAMEDLQADVATLAIGAAELVIERSLDHDTQVQLIENYINQVGSK
jgi:F-type H+-transporting ATPase subunit b